MNNKRSCLRVFRKFKIVFMSVFIIIILLLSVFLIDTYCMKNNKPVFFSTWGKKYTPVSPYSFYTVIDRTEICADALEYIGSDEEHDYYLPCIKSETIFIKYDNGWEETLKRALSEGHITIDSLLDHDIDLIREPKTSVNKERDVYLTSSQIIYSLTDKEIAFIIENKTNENLFTHAIPVLEFKTDLGWQILKLNNTVGFCGNKDRIGNSIEMIVMLNWYDDLKLGNYRISFNIYDEREEKLYSVSKEFSLE